MRSSFFGLEVAVRGLYTAQRNLDVVNHNINNATTPGYSRQQTIQSAARPMLLYDGTGAVGTGSDVTGVKRIRDDYLDFKYWSENVTNGEWSVKNDLLSDVQATFNEPSDSGFNTIMDEFFNSLQDLSKDPGNLAVRAVVCEKGVTLSKYFNNLATHFEKLQSDINYNIKTKVEEINSLGVQIEDLNRQIYLTELDGSNANDLRDKRTLLVDNLSKLVNIDASEVTAGKLPDGRDDKHFVITISGKTFVNHFSMGTDKSTSLSKLAIEQRDEKLNDEDIPGLYEVKWADDNSLEIRGGELKGYLDVRDGNDGQDAAASYTGPEDKSPSYKGIPYYINKLNEFARTFVMAFNEGYIDSNADGVIDTDEDGTGHADGYNLNSEEGDAVPGIRFFTMLGEGGKALNSEEFLDGASGTVAIYDCYKNVTAKNLCVSFDISDNYKNIATSDSPGEAGNIGNLNVLKEIRNNTHMFAEGSPEDFMNSMIAAVGIDAQQATRFQKNQDAMVKQLDNRRQSISGVSIEEESVSLVKQQQAYQGAAQMINTMAEVYDTLINKIGI